MPSVELTESFRAVNALASERIETLRDLLSNLIPLLHQVKSLTNDLTGGIVLRVKMSRRTFSVPTIQHALVAMEPSGFVFEVRATDR